MKTFSPRHFFLTYFYPIFSDAIESYIYETDFILVLNKQIIVKSFYDWFKLAAPTADCRQIAYLATFAVTSTIYPYLAGSSYLGKVTEILEKLLLDGANSLFTFRSHERYMLYVLSNK